MTTTKKAQPDYLKQPGGEPNWDAFDAFTAPQAPEKPEQHAGIVRTAGDMAIKGAQGIVDLGSSAVGLGSLATGGLVGQGMRAVGYDPKRTNEALGEYLSDDQKASDAAVQGEDSFLGAAGAALTHPRALAGSIVQSLPGMIAGMGASAAAARAIGTKAAAAFGGMETEAGARAAAAAIEQAGGKLMAIGSATEGAQSAGQIADDAQAAGRSYGEYAPAAVAAGLGTAAIGFGAGKLMGDAATDIATGSRTLAGSKAAKVGKEFLSEGVLEEMPQSAQEQYFTNIAQGESDLTKGVANAAGSGLVTGGVMGGGMGLLHGDHAPAPAPAPLADTGPLSRAANAAQAAAATQAAIAAAAAPVGPASGTPPAPANLPPLADIDARMEQLVALGRGAPAQRTTDAAGNRIDVPAVPGRRLTPEEITEYNGLKAQRAARVAIPQDQQGEFDTLLAQEQAERDQKFEPAKQAAAANRVATEQAQQQAAQKARDDAEHAQIAAMVDADEQLRQQTEKVRQQQDLDDIAARVERENAARAEANRAGLRDDVLADESIPAEGKKAAFRAALERNGYRNPDLTEADHGAIDAATAPLPSAPNELVDAVPERRAAAPAASATNTAAVDAAIAAGMRLKSAGGSVLHKPGSTKIFRLSTAQRAYYDKMMARQAAPAAQNAAAVPENTQKVPESAASVPQNSEIVSPAAELAAPATALDVAAHAAATSPHNDLAEPTQAQKEAGNYKVGRVSLHGLDISIENPTGSVRRGVDKAGKPWETTMNHHYGYIRGTVGADKDHIDTFIGPNHDSDKVFVVDQIHPDSGKFDEHKIMLGFDSLEEARAAYQSNYDANWTGGRHVSETTVAGFKAWLDGGKTKKPFTKMGAGGNDTVEDVKARAKLDGLSDEQAEGLAGGERTWRALFPDRYGDTPEQREKDPATVAAERSAQTPAGAKVLTKQDLNKMTVKDMSDAELLQAREVFAGAARAPKIEKEIAARGIGEPAAAPAAAPAEPAATEPGVLANATAPEHVLLGVDDRELGQIVAEFNAAQAEMMEGEHAVSNVFQPPAKGEVVRLNDKAKVYHKDHGWMTPAEARVKIEQWKAHAQGQGENDDIRRANSQRVVLSLFDLSGEWSRPWEEAGYQVFRFDIQDDPQVGDVNNFSSGFFNDWFGDFEGADIYAILAATPCTDFASSGARHFAAKDADGRTVSSVKLVHQTLRTIEHFKPSVWALENPVGRIESLGGLPPWRLSFDPNHLGDPYTKKTLIWGRFNGDLPVAPVEPTEGSKMHKLYGGKSMATKNARSVTPEGFSYGFFMANNAHDHPAMAIANKFDRLDRAGIERAVAAGVTESEINSAVEDHYYMDLDDDAANQAIRELADGASQPDPEPTKPTKPAKQKTEKSEKKADSPVPANTPAAGFGAEARAVKESLGDIKTFDDVAAVETRLFDLTEQMRKAKDPLAPLVHQAADSVRVFKMINAGDKSFVKEGDSVRRILDNVIQAHPPAAEPAAIADQPTQNDDAAKVDARIAEIEQQLADLRKDQKAAEAIGNAWVYNGKIKAAEQTLAGYKQARERIANPPAPSLFAANKLFTEDKVAAARARLKSKLGTLNSGIDPELMMDGITIAGAYIEAGVRSFAAFSKAMIGDLGEGVRPYLRSFYEGTRHYPGLDTTGMTTPAEIDAMEKDASAPHTQPSTEKNEAIGETVKAAPKPKKTTDTVLRDDWGVSHIDGWTPIAGGANEQTDYGLRGGLKDAFLKDAQNYLRKVSGELQAQGFVPYKDAKGKLVKAVRVSESGTAGSGDVALSMLHPDKQHGIYMTIGGTAIRGMVPATASGVAVMMRVGTQDNQSGTRDMNRWMPVNLSAVDLAEQAAKAVHAKAVAAAQLANPVTINHTETIPAPAETKEQHDDSTPASDAPALDTALDEGQPAGSGDAPAVRAGKPRTRAGRNDDGVVREPRGRDQSANDARPELGNQRGDRAISDAAPRAVAGRDERVSADFRPDVGGLTREGSWFDTARRNVDLIELARRIEDEGRAATPAEQAELSKYVGFGASAIRNKLFPIPSGYAKAQEPNRLIWPNLVQEANWRALAERMDALPAAWQKSVLQSSQYAHYTSEGIIRSTWGAMQRLGFTGGKVFEPGMGIGSFAMLMPESVRDTSRYTGVEFDGPTALIARLLSPEQNMLHDDFIKRKFPKDFFDVAIGNPPFSQTQIFADPDYEKHGFMLHDFFFAKSIDRVRPGGLLAFVTSKGTMDKQTDKARKYLSARADLLGAIRLPSTAFEDNAGTSVVTDVIFLRKRADGEAPAGEKWAGVASVDTKDGVVVINEYFANHPEMVLGQNRISGNTDDMGRRINSNGRGGEAYTVVSYDDTPAELDAKFAKAVEKLPPNVYSVLTQSGPSVQRETAKVDFDPSIKREGVVYLAKDGTVMRVENGVGQPLEQGMKMTEADHKWFAGYVGLRDLVQAARLAQNTDGKWEAALKKLNKAYDAFRAEHGPINDFRVQVRKSTDEEGKAVETESRVFKNRRRYREDYDSSILTQLETINEAGEIVKSAFLLGRTIGVPATRDVKTIGDALAVSLDETGRLNLDDVGRRIGLSREEAIEALGNQVFRAPAGDWQLADEYLSGDVVSKLEEAEQAARLDDSLTRNVEALKAAQPEKLGPSQISAKLGASWIPAAHVNEFAKEIEAGAVTFDSKTETWQVAGGNLRSGRRAGAEYGTAARSPSELLEAALNSRSVKITTKVDEKTVTDQEATTAANEMLKKIKDKFKGWIWTDSERASELVEAYNRRFNNIAPRRFDGSHLTLPGVSMRYQLHPHQKRAIWRVVQTGDTYLNHAVGSGKTIEMIAAGMEQKRLGLINKPMYVVPNHMLEQFANEFMELYPLANIMVADDENFSAERRKAFIAGATLNKPDAVIITHDAFQRIGVKEESVAPIRDEILADLEIELSETAKDNGARVRRSQLEQQIEAVTQRFDRIISAGGKDSTLKFEDIGVDFIFADEAHVFRKLDFHTAQQIKGIDPNGSKRALDMYVKTRFLQQQRPGRAMVFASGTPVTNTMGELYTIMRFFAPEELNRGGIATFDAWARQFGEVAPALEPNAAGKYELIERFAKFDNVPELMSRVRQFMDVLTSEHLGALVKRPDLIGGKPHLNVVAPSADLEQYMKTVLGPRIEVSKRWKPTKEQPNNPDPIVSIITDGRFAAIDPRFFGGALGDEGSIITDMGDKVVAAYMAGKDNVYQDKNGKDEPIKGSTQVVFYNMGFGEQSQKNRGFNARAAFTKRLTDGGIPRDQIAWFDDANTDAKKEAVFKAMRSGKLRVLIGSAKKMGTGVNVQKRLAVLHYQDPPWFPADVEQPHGRIIRQGNQNAEVGIEWYTTKGTYQSTMWQMVGRKQRFIDQAFSGDKTLRSMEDMGEASLFEQAAAVASGDPRAIQLAGLKQDVERFERLQAAHASEQINVRSALRGAEWQVESAKKRINTLGAASKAIGERFYAFTSGTIGGRTFDKVGEFGQAVKDAFNKVAADAIMGKSAREVQIGTLGDNLALTVDAEKAGKDEGEYTLYVTVGELPLSVTTAAGMGETVDAVGLGRRIVNQVNSISSDLANAKSSLTSGETDLIRLRKKNGAPFEYQQEMVEKYGELKRLEEELRLEGMAPAAVPIVINEDGTTAEEAGQAPADPAFSRARIDSDDPLVNIFSRIAQDDAAFRLPASDGKTLSAVMGDMAPGLIVDEFYGAGAEEDQKIPVDRVWTITAPGGEQAWVYRNNKNKEIWLDISNWKEGKEGAAVYQAVATFAKNTGHTFIGDPQGLSDKALYRRTEHMISSALRHGTTEHLAPHARQTEQSSTATGAAMRPVKWQAGEHAANLREMLVSSYTNILHAFPEINDVTYNFASDRFERTPVRASAGEVLADESVEGQPADAQGPGSGRARGDDGRSADGADESAGNLGRVDAVAFTDADFAAAAQSVRDAYDALFPSDRGALTPPLGVSDLKRAALVGTVLRAEGSAAGRAVLDHVSDRLLQRVSPQLDSVLYSRDAEYFRDDGNFLPAMPAGVDTGAAAPLELTGRELVDAKKSTEQLNRQLVKAGMAPVRALRVAPNANFALARRIGETLGIKVNFVSKNADFEGVAYDGVAYLADGMRNAELAIAGHETLHALEQGNPELGAKLRGQIRAYLKEGVVGDRQAREYAASGFQEVTDEQAEAEVIADINGAMWMDPKFWSDLAKADRSLFRSVAYKFMEVAAKAIKSLRGSRFDVSALVRDVEAVRAIMVSTWTEHNAGRDRVAVPAKNASWAPAPGLVAPENQLSEQSLQEIADSALAGLNNAPPIFVLKSPEFLLAHGIRVGAVPVSAGAMIDGKIFLFQNGIRSAAKARVTIWHELFHYGLRKLMTPEAYAAALTGLYNSDEKVKAYAQRWSTTEDAALRHTAGVSVTDMHLISVEEALANIAEQLKAGGAEYVGDRSMPRTVRNIIVWMAKTAERMGLAKIGASLRGMTLSEGEKFVASVFARTSDGEQPPPGNMADLDRRSINFSGASGRFYSALSQALPGMRKIADKAGMVKPDQALAWLAARQKEGKFKAEELQWSGLTDWLGMQAGKVAVDSIGQFAAANGVQLQEVQKGGDGGAGVKYGRYVLPGGENYRELLLTVPSKGDKSVTAADLPHLFMLDGGKSLVRDENGFKIERYIDDRHATRISDEEAVRIYTEANGKNEILRKSNLSSDYHNDHWDEPNIIAHVRFNDRVDADGNKVLFIEELQSDWAQQGLKKGFADSHAAEQIAALEGEISELYEEEQALDRQFVGATADINHHNGMRGREQQVAFHTERRAQISGKRTGVYRQRIALEAQLGKVKLSTAIPTGPFVTKTEGWLQLGIKRMIAYAVEHGYDKVAFANGEQSADRYDLSKQVDQIRYIKRADGTFDVWASDADGRALNDTVDKQGLTPAEIENFVGKEVANKIVDGAGRDDGGDMVLEGVDLKVGGEGMKAFYDKIVPQNVNDVLKKLGGGKVENIALSTTAESLADFGIPDGFMDEENMKPLHKGGRTNQTGFAITDAMRTHVANGLPLFSRAGLGDALASAAGSIADVRLPADYRIGDLFNSSGKISWWHKTIGTMENLAKRHPAFARVYEAVQAFIGDVSRYAVVAADLAPTLLPKLENISDIIGKNRKKALTAEDTKAIGAPIFEGTLAWARDAHGNPVKIAELEEQAAAMTTAQKAQILIKKGVIDDAQNQAWLGNPLDFYAKIIDNKFTETQLKAGVVWSDAELRSMFNLNDEQVALYHEFRDATDKSLTNLTISEMVKMGGKDAKGLIEQAVAAPDLIAASNLLRDHFMALAEMHPEQADMHLDTAKQILNLADKGQDLMDRGYAPLSRFGKYTVYVTERDDTGTDQQLYFGMFETQYEASKMARNMAAEHPEARVQHGTISEDAYKLFTGVSPETIELFGSIVGLDSSADAKSTEVYQTYLKLAKNNRSSMKRLIHRKGISGFSEDAGRVLAGFIYSNARLTAANAHLGEIDEAVTEIPKQQGELTDAAMQLREHIRNPEGGGSALGGMMFAQFLGGSVASAMVNLTQPFTMTLPYLSQWGGIAKAGKRLAAAVRLAGKETTGDEALDAALKWASDEGIVAPQEVHYLMAQAQGKGALQAGDGTKAGNLRAALNNTMSKVSLGWGKLFAMAELTNRRVTFIAAYRTAVEEGRPNPERFAQEAVSQTQGTYNAGNKPKWARGTVGSLLMTFKQFSIGYLELLSRMAFAGEPGSKERAAGRRAALYMVAVLFLMGGADGLPFEQDLEDALDGILQRMGFNFSTKRSKQAFLTDVLGQGGADFALKGISSMPGMPIDVSGRFGMGNLIPGTGLLTKKQSYTSDLGELAGPGGDIAKRLFTGAGKALGGDLAGAALDLSPASVRNVVKGVDMLDTGTYRDGRGYIVNRTTPGEAIMKMVGFQPNSTADIQDQKGQALNMISQNRMRSTEIAEHWAQGLANKNPEMVQEARDMRADWNAKNPEAPIRIDMPSIIRRVRAMKEDAIARTQKTAPAALKQTVRHELAATRE